MVTVVDGQNQKRDDAIFIKNFLKFSSSSLSSSSSIDFQFVVLDIQMSRQSIRTPARFVAIQFS
jgi:hypothetical protein